MRKAHSFKNVLSQRCEELSNNVTCKKRGHAYPAHKTRCKECVREYGAAYRERNGEKSNAASRAWRSANPEKYMAQQRAYREANREKCNAATRAWNKAYPEKLDAAVRAWQRANPEKCIAIDHARRARIRGAEGTFTADDWRAIKERQHSCCALCKAHRKLEVDHIVPLSRGGSNWPDNIQGLCRSCNARKNDKLPHELRLNPTTPELLAS